ncbi:MAG TPA: zinc ribbon domain-containing protein [Blastocatellia bacterium]|nr:zinc ribbon domain-containing protein [Blastocatellia bacterium]
MYCPTCSTQAIEGAKFCKTCGMNLNVVTQALNGEVIVTDPLREREFKRARKQVSDGIHGIAVGAALLVAAALPYILNKAVGLPLNNYLTALALALALAGVIKLFRSTGSIIDAKVGQKLLDPALQPRATGNLNSVAASTATGPKSSQRLAVDATRLNGSPPAQTRPVALEADKTELKPAEGGAKTPPLPTGTFDQTLLRPATGRINREHSTPLRRLEKEDDLLSKLRN